MARPLRIQYPGAIYHAMARGNGRQKLFYDQRDYQRMLHGLEQTVIRTRWELLAFVWMPNHIHLFFRTPQPNLSRGMQYLLSGYANWFAKRHGRSGHLFQGRFRGELIEDESYFWTVSRYLHLNPTRGKHPLVAHPRDWIWSSYPGYASNAARFDWISYDTVWKAWQGEMGGSHPQRAYRRFVEQGLATPPANPLLEAWDGWLLGSERFVERIRKESANPQFADQVPAARRLVSLDPAEIVSAVASYFDESPEWYRVRRSTARGRDLAAYLAHRHTTATLRQLAPLFGLSHPDSVSNLIRRAQRDLAESPQLRKQRNEIVSWLETPPKTENRV